MAPPGPVDTALGGGNKAYGSKSGEGTMRAADDFHIIRARMAELQRERDEKARRKDNEERIRRMGNAPIEEVRPRPYRTSLE